MNDPRLPASHEPKPSTQERVVQPGELVRDTAMDSSRNFATAVYALQAASFLLFITAIVAVVLAYIKRGESRGTWLESHFRWQIRTFWWSLLWGLLGLATALVLVGYVILLSNAAWVVYRIARGWINLADGKAMYQ